MQKLLSKLTMILLLAVPITTGHAGCANTDPHPAQQACMDGCDPHLVTHAYCMQTCLMTN